MKKEKLQKLLAIAKDIESKRIKTLKDLLKDKGIIEFLRGRSGHKPISNAYRVIRETIDLNCTCERNKINEIIRRLNIKE